MKKPQSSAGAAIPKNRPQPSKSVQDSAKAPTPPAPKSPALGADGQQATSPQMPPNGWEIDPPSKNEEPLQHGHSAELKFGAVDGAVPWKGLK